MEVFGDEGLVTIHNPSQPLSSVEIRSDPMKRSGALVASMAAAAISSSSSSATPSLSPREEAGKRMNEGDDHHSPTKSSDSKDKFAPRFDGLRFIETLVTAHR